MRHRGTWAQLISESEVCCRWWDMWTPLSSQMSRTEQRQEADTGRQLPDHLLREWGRQAAGSWPYITPRTCLNHHPAAAQHHANPPQRLARSWKYTLGLETNRTWQTPAWRQEKEPNTHEIPIKQQSVAGTKKPVQNSHHKSVILTLRSYSSFHISHFISLIYKTSVK